jgi:ABC-type uncharacterized transport system auxiliary subunit
MRYAKLLAAAACAVLVTLAGCASTELATYDYRAETVSVDVRVAPQAEVDASYIIVFDAENPVRTALSIGSSLAKSNQVAEVEQKLYGAMQETDIRSIVQDELSGFIETTLGSRVVESRRDADLQLLVDIESYGVDAGGPGAAVEFEITAFAVLRDVNSNRRVWRTRESVTRPASPAVFGLPAAAGNVLSAVALAGLTEEEIAVGLERLAREAAWEIGLELEKDITRARRRR